MEIMTEKQKFCPRCGTPHDAGAKFCRSCGKQFTVTGGPPAREAIREMGDAIEKATSVPGKVESVVRTAESMARAAWTEPPLILRPPVEWKVIIGDMGTDAGKRALESVIREKQEVLREEIREGIRGEIHEDVSMKGDGDERKAPEKKTHPVPQPPTSPPPPVCPSCKKPLTPETKFCGNCGTPVRKPVEAGEKKPMSRTCPNCNGPVLPGDSFCTGCGAPVSAGSPLPLSCPSCGNPVTPGKKFCAKCGRNLVE